MLGFQVPPATPQGSGPAALIIDDSLLFRRSLRRLLESEGLRVVAAAEGGILGAEYAHSFRPDLIILDHGMPDLNGIGCLRAIREAGIRSTVIVCSAELTLEQSQEYLMLGAASIFIKPLPLAAFRRAIRGLNSPTPQALGAEAY